MAIRVCLLHVDSHLENCLGNQTCLRILSFRSRPHRSISLSLQSEHLQDPDHCNADRFVSPAFAMAGLFGDIRLEKFKKGGVLFATHIPQKRSMSPLDLFSDVKQGPVPGRGYFAFPPPCPEGSRPPRMVDMNEEQLRQPHDSPAVLTEAESLVDHSRITENEKEVFRRENERRKRLALEREAAMLGEIEWVRTGGVLRDARGRRDEVRMEIIRQEIRQQEREKSVLDRWEAYERKWHVLLATDGPVSFKDIPWPILTCPSSVGELTITAISDFLLEPLKVRVPKETERERIRNSLLRWHPDKLLSVLSRVVASDTEMVRDGVNVVSMVLKDMMDR